MVAVAVDTLQFPLSLSLSRLSSFSLPSPELIVFFPPLDSKSHHKLIYSSKTFTPGSIKPLHFHSKRFVSFKARATAAESDQPKWWEKTGGPNMVDIHSAQDYLSALSQAGNRLVIVEFYGTWCASCRALFPKLCKTAEEHPEILFLKVNFDENKSLCKSLNVKVLPYFHFYRGADGQLESFSCSLAKFQKIKDAIAAHKKSSCDTMPLKEKTSESFPR